MRNIIILAGLIAGVTALPAFGGSEDCRKILALEQEAMSGKFTADIVSKGIKLLNTANVFCEAQNYESASEYIMNASDLFIQNS
jgi:hypothetical protein